jgi:hypothetical protein
MQMSLEVSGEYKYKHSILKNEPVCASEILYPRTRLENTVNLQSRENEKFHILKNCSIAILSNNN